MFSVLSGQAKGMDPVLPFANIYLWWVVGIIEIGISFYIVKGKKLLFKHYLISLLSANFILYRIALHFIAPDKPCPCLGGLETGSVFSSKTMEITLITTAIYLCLLSIIFLAVHFLNAIHRRSSVVG